MEEKERRSGSKNGNEELVTKLGRICVESKQIEQIKSGGENAQRSWIRRGKTAQKRGTDGQKAGLDFVCRDA